ncbi:glycosyltransferase [Brevibacterium antiquum]|nr:glycosyltransferase [Brevibacterium antiquum]
MDILTFAPNFDAASRQEELRNDGLIGELVHIRNLWSELRDATDEYLRTIPGAVDTVVDDSERTPTIGQHDFELLGASGEVLQTTRFRSDGSLLATDRLDVKSLGQVGGRRVTLYSESGDAISQWRSATAFYAAWIEAVLRDEPSIIICDSAFVGGLFAGRKFDQAKFVQVLHSHHRDNTQKYYNSLAQGKLAILSNSDYFDKVAVLTDRQYKAIRDEDIASDNFGVISNTFNGEVIDSVNPRRRGKGIIVARLSGHKQIDHAINAVRDIDVQYGVTLDIYGTGDAFSYLAGIVNENSLEDRVSFHGYHPDARANFREGSFSLLTSKSEGQGLVLLESMAAGCIPIAYDMEFGPSDIISHGIDGFLVPPDDKMELARTIQKFMTLPEHEVEVMREAAVGRASEFSAEAITSLWGNELKSIAASPEATGSWDVKARLVGLKDRADGFHATVEIEGLSSNEASWCKLV